MFFIATKFFKFKMVKDTVQSLKAENDKLKEKWKRFMSKLRKFKRT